jgi:hypothetical protein
MYVIAAVALGGGAYYLMGNSSKVEGKAKELQGRAESKAKELQGRAEGAVSLSNTIHGRRGIAVCCSSLLCAGPAAKG